MCRLYVPDFYEDQAQGSLLSARVIVPILCRLLRPTSVVDVGCGVGTWLTVWAEQGVDQLVGIDGAWAAPLQQKPLCYDFVAMDLAQPQALDRRFSVATCLEVAEHLPPENAPRLVQYLCDLAPVVCFGAAIPGQSGRNHVNEQWPSYWAALFREAGCIVADLRELTWQTTGAKPWYLQNTLVYIREECALEYPELAPILVGSDAPVRDYVHPEMFLYAASMGGVRTKDLVSLLCKRLFTKWQDVARATRRGMRIP